MPIVAGRRVTVTGVIVINGHTHPTTPVTVPIRPIPPPAPQPSTRRSP